MHDSNANKVVALATKGRSTEPHRQTKAQIRHRFSAFYNNRWLIVGIFLPAFMGLLYYGVIASDRYVSEAQFIVSQTAGSQASGGLASLLKTTGIAGGADNSSAVQAYIRSRSAVTALEGKIDLKKVYDKPNADFLARWPSVFYGPSEEEFYKYYRSMVQIYPDQETGVMTLKVQAFDPEDARKIASILIDLSENVINNINERMLKSSLRAAQDEVTRSEEALEKSQVTLTMFRNRELTLDPENNAVMLTELIGKLNSQLAETQTQIDEITRNAPSSPQINPLKVREETLRQQIEQQRKIVSAQGNGLADKVSEYERLKLQNDFSLKRVSASVTSLTLAQAEARRQSLYLERIVEPNLPDKATQPQRLVLIVTILGWSSLLYLVVWLMASGLKEHASAGK
jgi:capsular polysaccharide transport system permease protein